MDRFPQATLHFIGHSNGTYVLGQSLKNIPAMRFERVYLAASPLPREYNWHKRFDAGQVTSVVNVRASKDVSIALLCGGLRGGLGRLGYGDIGTAGVGGFNFGDSRLREIQYLRGGHSAAVREENLDSIVAFILFGDREAPGSELVSEREVPSLFRNGARWAPFALWALLLAEVGWILYVGRDVADGGYGSLVVFGVVHLLLALILRAL